LINQEFEAFVARTAPIIIWERRSSQMNSFHVIVFLRHMVIWCALLPMYASHMSAILQSALIKNWRIRMSLDASSEISNNSGRITFLQWEKAVNRFASNYCKSQSWGSSLGERWRKWRPRACM